MLYVIEGLDRTGKSTLAEELTPEPEDRILHFSAPTKHPVEEYMRPLLDYDPRSGDTWAIDRHYLGELVWPGIFGRESQFDPQMALFIELFLASRGAVPLYAWRRTDELIEACKDEPVNGLVAPAKYAFHKATQVSWLNWQQYKHEQTSIFELYSKGFWASLAVRDVFDVGWRWIGHPDPEYLLVGEQVNQPEESAGLPFIPYRGRSGHFLMDALQTHHLGDHRVAMINAVDPDGNFEPVDAYWEALGKPPVVALGKVADEVLDVHAVPHERVYHPQYWKRFHAKAGKTPYAKLIKEAAKL